MAEVLLIHPPLNNN